MTLNRKAVVSPNRIHPFSASSDPISRHRASSTLGCFTAADGSGHFIQCVRTCEGCCFFGAEGIPERFQERGNDGLGRHDHVFEGMRQIRNAFGPQRPIWLNASRIGPEEILNSPLNGV
jgi:hypothetical protein